jgi:hypothetical protein
MINERLRHIWRRIWAGWRRVCSAQLVAYPEADASIKQQNDERIIGDRYRSLRDFSGLPAAVQATAETFSKKPAVVFRWVRIGRRQLSR